MLWCAVGNLASPQKKHLGEGDSGPVQRGRGLLAALATHGCSRPSIPSVRGPPGGDDTWLRRLPAGRPGKAAVKTVPSGRDGPADAGPPWSVRVEPRQSLHGMGGCRSDGARHHRGSSGGRHAPREWAAARSGSHFSPAPCNPHGMPCTIGHRSVLGADVEGRAPERAAQRHADGQQQTRAGGGVWGGAGGGVASHPQPAANPNPNPSPNPDPGDGVASHPQHAATARRS